MSKSYTTNLTQEQWELIEPLIPLAKKGGRNREVDMWAVINANILYRDPRMHMAKPPNFGF